MLLPRLCRDYFISHDKDSEDQLLGIFSFNDQSQHWLEIFPQNGGSCGDCNGTIPPEMPEMS